MEQSNPSELARSFIRGVVGDFLESAIVGVRKGSGEAGIPSDGVDQLVAEAGAITRAALENVGDVLDAQAAYELAREAEEDSSRGLDTRTLGSTKTAKASTVAGRINPTEA